MLAPIIPIHTEKILPVEEIQNDLFTLYLDYTSNTEVPAFFSRWCLLSGIGALLGRRYHLQFGTGNIYPNQYIMLMGEAGSRKSTAVKQIKKLLTLSGYETFAAEKTSKEKFLIDMEGADTGEESGGYKSAAAFLDASLFGSNDPREMFIVSDEFNDFIGTNNMEFVSLLGNLWDFSGTYKYRTKGSKEVVVNEPTVSILGGNTSTNFSKAFPPEIIGQGFFSRLLLIHGEPNGKSIAFPELPDPKQTASIVEFLQLIKSRVIGCSTISPTAKLLLEKIYRSTRAIIDPRFSTYYTRRFTHLLKLCLGISAARLSVRIDECDVVRANTVLTFTEQLMPKALGEFGRSKNSDVNHKIIQALSNASVPLYFKDLWKVISSDVDQMDRLSEIIRNLQQADKIQLVGDGGVLIRKELMVHIDNDTVDWSYLTDEERRVTK